MGAAGPAVLRDGGSFHLFAVSGAVAPLDDDAAAVGLTHVVWPDAGECACVAAEPPMFGGAGSSSGINSSDAGLLFPDDLVSATTVGRRRRAVEAATVLLGVVVVVMATRGIFRTCPIFSL